MMVCSGGVGRKVCTSPRLSFPSIYFTQKISSILRVDDDTVLVPKRRRLNKNKKKGILFSWSTSSSNKLVVFVKPSQVNIPKSSLLFLHICFCEDVDPLSLRRIIPPLTLLYT
jgi:hypothetical protein